MSQNLAKIIKQVEKDADYYSGMVKNYMENSKEWNYHLGHLDGLLSVRWKLQQLQKELLAILTD